MYLVVDAMFKLIWSNFTITEYIRSDRYYINHLIGPRYRQYLRELRSVPSYRFLEKAVLCSQYFLRDFCREFFLRVEESMVDQENFKFCVYFLLDNWIRHRKDVFTKVIDCFAIIAEAVLYLKEETGIILELQFAPELFCNYFKCNLAAEFRRKGGWEELGRKATEDYSYLYSFLEEFLRFPKDPNILSIFDQDRIDILRNSTVMFPVSYLKMRKNFIEMLEEEKTYYIDFDMSNNIFEKCSLITSQVYFSIVYVRRYRNVENEFRMKSNLSEGDFAYVFVGGSVEGHIDLVEMNGLNPSAHEEESKIENMS